MRIEQRLKQTADALTQSVQDVDVVAHLQELPKRQRAQSRRAVLVALAILAGALVPVLAGPLRDRAGIGVAVPLLLFRRFAPK
jgi:hypothetical protein